MESEAERMSSFPYDIEGFFDGGCPLCRREINFLRHCDRRGKIRLTEIRSPDVQAAEARSYWIGATPCLPATASALRAVARPRAARHNRIRCPCVLQRRNPT